MSPNLPYRVEVPGGLWKEGTCVRQAQLRALNGGDEAFLLEVGESLSAAARTTVILARCMQRLGTDLEVTADDVRCLTVGDREALLLHLWRITFGERLPCLVTCQRSACGEKMDLELNVRDLLLTPYRDSQEWHEIPVEVHEKHYLVRLRVPNGMDQELAAERARTNLQEAEDLLLRRCVSEISEKGFRLLREEWTAELADSIGRKMVELDPQAEILLQFRCLACDEAFTAEFDAGTYLYQELHGHIPYLYHEVHQIARSYHWSEEEILSMTPRKRSIYLRLLAGEEVH